MQGYDHLFTQGAIGKQTTCNRFVAQPMEGNDAVDGNVSQRTLKRYQRLAQGNWGVIVVEAISVDASSLARKNQLVLTRDHISGFRELVRQIKHISPQTVVMFQITHAGRKGGKEFSQPTALYEPAHGARLLTTSEVHTIAKQFIEAAFLAEQAGADGVDIKLCHGYFGSETLRPANIRRDEWGGSFENRTRFLRIVGENVKKNAQRSDFIIGSRISYYEGIRGGCGTVAADDIVEELDEMDQVVRLMENLGFDYVNVSAGIPGLTSEITRPTLTSRWLYLHQFRYARRAKRIAPAMTVIGSAYTVLQDQSLAAAEENISRGDIDFAGWGRQNLADPCFPLKVKEKREVSYCKVCSHCSRAMARQEEVGCHFFPLNDEKMD